MAWSPKFTFTVTWDNVSGKPLTFTPSAHSHAAGDVTSGTFANARISQSSVTQHQAALSIGWGQLTGLPAFATRWPTWNEVTGKPSIPTSADYVATSGNQSGLSGNKSWTGDHVFNVVEVNTAGGTYGLRVNASGGYIGGLSGIGGTTLSLHGEGNVIHISPNGRNETPRTTFFPDGSITTSGDIAVNGNTVWHAGNFNPSDKVTSSPQDITDWNSPIGTVGTFPITSSSGSDNGPGSANYIGLHEERSGSGWVQWALRVGNPTTGREMWIRHGNQNGIADWESVWHSGNLNPSSKADSSVTLTAGTGLNGGGDLSSDRTFYIDTGVVARIDTAGYAPTGDYDTFPIGSRGYTAAGAENPNSPGTNLFLETVGGFAASDDRQFAWPHRNNGQFRFRCQTGGTYGPWKEIWTSDSMPTTTYGRNLVNQNTASAARSHLGLASVAYTNNANTFTFSQYIQSSSAQLLLIERTGNSSNAIIAHTTTAGSVYSGNASGDVYAIGGGANLSTISNRWADFSSSAINLRSSTNVTGSLTASGNIYGNALYGASFRSNSGSGDLSAEGSGDGIRLMPNGYTTTNMTHITGDGNMSVGGNVTANGGNVYAGSSARMRSTGSHNVISCEGGGTIYLRPNGDTVSSGQFRVLTSGNVIADGTVTATNLVATNSDPRLKTNKQQVKARRELIEKLEYWSFEWKKDGTKGRSVMADKVQEIAPEHVHVADDEMGTLSVDKGALALEMVFALIDMLKEEDDAAS